MCSLPAVIIDAVLKHAGLRSLSCRADDAVVSVEAEYTELLVSIICELNIHVIGILWVPRFFDRR